jgi:diadenosine tetraphosphate (Ap4A) HIT family hydrolase
MGAVIAHFENQRRPRSEIPHFHMHVVPRTTAGDWGFGPPHIASLDHPVVTGQKIQTAARLRKHFVHGSA